MGIIKPRIKKMKIKMKVNLENNFLENNKKLQIFHNNENENNNKKKSEIIKQPQYNKDNNIQTSYNLKNALLKNNLNNNSNLKNISNNLFRKDSSSKHLLGIPDKGENLNKITNFEIENKQINIINQKDNSDSPNLDLKKFNSKEKNKNPNKIKNLNTKNNILFNNDKNSTPGPIILNNANLENNYFYPNEKTLQNTPGIININNIITNTNEKKSEKNLFFANNNLLEKQNNYNLNYFKENLQTIKPNEVENNLLPNSNRKELINPTSENKNKINNNFSKNTILRLDSNVKLGEILDGPKTSLKISEYNNINNKTNTENKNKSIRNINHNNKYEESLENSLLGTTPKDTVNYNGLIKTEKLNKFSPVKSLTKKIENNFKINQKNKIENLNLFNQDFHKLDTDDIFDRDIQNINNIEEENNLHFSNENKINQPEIYKKRIFSSKLKKQKTYEFRPNTANHLSSKNRIMKNLNNNTGANSRNENIPNKFLCEKNLNIIKNKIDEFSNEKKSPKTNRPFTAMNLRNSAEGYPNNIINININVYNIQSNSRYLNPVPKNNLIYVNESLKNSNKNIPKFNKNFEKIIMNNINQEDGEKKIFKMNTHNNANIENVKNKFLNLNQNNKKKAEIIFDNLVRSIGKHDNSDKILTINDLK